MGKKRISDSFELTEAEKRRRKKNELLAFPIFSIVIAAITIAPPLIFTLSDERSPYLMYIPIAFGALLLFSGFSKLIGNRKEIAAFLSKKDKDKEA